MWWNNLKFGLRNLSKNRFFSITSILGLAIGIAACLLMLVYIHHELNYDRHNESPEEVYRVIFDKYIDLGEYATTPLPVGPALKVDFPEIKAMTRIAQGFESLARFEENKFFERINFVDTGFTEVFALDFTAGDPKSALGAPNQAIISESYAKKYFGERDPMGKTIQIGSSGSLNSVVMGVFKDMPQNAHIRFDFALPFTTFEKVWGKESTGLWLQMPENFTYVRLHQQEMSKGLAAKLPDFAKQHLENAIEDPASQYQLALQPLLDIHLKSNLQRDRKVGNMKVIYLLGSIALLVLLISIINYINFSTARFTRRVKEVSIRKIIGARRGQLLNQFLGEIALVVIGAGLLSLVLAEAFRPVFNSISGIPFSGSDLRTPMILIGVLAIMVGVSLGAGLFPALLLSNFKPGEILRGKWVSLSFGKSSRKVLVVLQFTASAILMAASIIAFQQMQFVRSSIVDSSESQVAVFQMNNTLHEKFDILREQLLKHPQIIHIAGGSNVPSFYGDSWPVRRTVDGEKVQTENYAITNDYLVTLGYELIAGRELKEENTNDVSSGFILNEMAVKRLDLESPEKALGQSLYWGGDNLKKGTVVGIVKDFHFNSLHEQIKPAILQFAPYEWMTNNFMAIRILPENLDEIYQYTQEQVAQIDPNWLADLHFLDDNFLALHQKDLQEGRLFGGFAVLAIFLSCLGLLGLITFAVERRTKEIGIRKVLGASISSIVGLLSQEFIHLVLLALVLAFPLVWYGMNQWLENFVYRISIDIGVFGITAMGILLIAFFSTSFQSIQAALGNPVNALKEE